MAKYFAILPAIFIATYAAKGSAQGPLHVLSKIIDLLVHNLLGA